MTFVRTPFGKQDVYQPDYGATIAYTLISNNTVIIPAALTGNLTLNLTAPTGVAVGDELTCIFTASGGNRTVTFGTGFMAGTADLVVTSGTTQTAQFIYSGTGFTEKAEPTGIDAAAVALNTTHRTSDGKNHSDVVLNNTHRTSNGNDHSNVVLNNAHRTCDGSDHSAVATATTGIANILNGTTARTGRIKNTTAATIGTPGTGVTAVEYGDGSNRVTVLTLTNVDLGTIAGAGNAATGALIYTFPAGAHLHYASRISVGVVGDLAVQADTPDLGLGSVIATGAIAVLSGDATFEDYLTGQTMTNVSGTATAAGPLGATAGILTGISLSTPAAAKTVHLNIADGWAAATANLLASGTVVLVWTVM